MQNIGMKRPGPGSEEECREWLEELRWPRGAECPRCSVRDVARIKDRKQLRCRSCDYRFSVTVGTAFASSHLPLGKWFLATQLIAESRGRVSAKELQRALGVTYKTAWYLGHRIRAAMGGSARGPLGGVVNWGDPHLLRDTLLRLIDGAPPLEKLVPPSPAPL
jgi:transposase-like protein